MTEHEAAIICNCRKCGQFRPWRNRWNLCRIMSKSARLDIVSTVDTFCPRPRCPEADAKRRLLRKLRFAEAERSGSRQNAGNPRAT